MTNKEKILEIINKQGKIQYVNIVMSDLVIEKQIFKIGSTRYSFYVSSSYAKEHPEIFPSVFKKRYKNKSLEEHKVLAEIEEKFLQIKDLPENIKSIFTFSFSEMFNNAIEHSTSKNIIVEVSIKNNNLSFIVLDSGVGAFRNIMKRKNLNSEIEAIQDLLKGKTTTMPKSHSGEGIFFTSKSADLFILDSFGYQLIVSTRIGDVSIKNVSVIKRGTKVFFEIDINSERHLDQIFKKYTNLIDEGNFGFDKTEIRVKLYTIGGVHISRSQARRILFGLEKFKIILFDFENVPVVGQAFADEIYRVFQNKYPDIKIEEENMSEGVQFMIERAKNGAKNNN
ncbi:MAG: STAS-like domain-containing protein [Candidatus Taylorbacteria bacterium]|nr:STAS-like domain-containing protein [Candidatus Taylorbacteria bacterium]